MKQEVINNSTTSLTIIPTTLQISEKVRKYNCFWKQEVILSDCEEYCTQMDSDDEREYISQINLERTFKIIEAVIPKSFDILSYSQYPAKKIHQFQTPQNIYDNFFPNSLIITLTDLVNQYLLEILEEDLKQQPSKIQSHYNKKKYKETEIQLYFGLQILFGIFRFPYIDDYWNAEPWLRCGIEYMMPIGRFKFLDTHLFMYLNEKSKSKLQNELQQFQKTVKSICQPEQELILIEQIYKAYTTYYLLDFQRLFIIDLIVVSHRIQLQDKINRLMRMLFKYSNHNHILYVMFELNLERIIQLTDQDIYPIITYEKTLHQTIQNLLPGEYQIEQLYLIKNKSQVHLFPQKQSISNKSILQVYKDIQQQYYENSIMNLLQYRSNFYLCSQLNNIEGFNQLRIEFEEYFEVMIYNTSLLIEDMLQSNFRISLAKIFTLEKAQQIETNLQKAKKRMNSTFKESATNTQSLEFGLNKQYSDLYHTPIPQKQEESFKYCVVCMKFNQLTKPFYRCRLCEKLFNENKIFICAFPCFELFHRNPSDFIECDIKIQEQLSDGVYFKKDTNTQIQNHNQDDEFNLKRKKQDKQNQRNYSSYNKEIYKQSNLEDFSTYEELSKKYQSVIPSPNLLQPIITKDQYIQQQPILGHRNDLNEIENRLDEQKKKFKIQLIKHLNQQGQSNLQITDKQTLLDIDESKKNKKLQKLKEKNKLLELQMKTISPLEKFMETLNKQPKLEDQEQ
ncbi:unnamed protein product [Paramecium primaurelia]|uniref:PiggyBac transposable element-derived protein domain-containing protein n=1 Tax=Paramecium primaurelia TaxID=5886 RepID=A0A8S1KEN0_PARPR|nr:unnamed protein product [Paramecium primaurelia]